MAKFVLCHVAKLSKIKQMWHLQMICSKFTIEVNPFFRPVFCIGSFLLGGFVNNRKTSSDANLFTDILYSLFKYSNKVLLFS